ncbi:hypothetical protein Scep_001985 [Stephania cephalantha]|uniref:Uncharacterized protein n=1 Tax=Stephania cephalantha TaxID=152367 RepID=A0AAP0Q5K4_9MAGN
MILSPNHHHLARSPSHPTLAFFRKPQQRLRRRRRRLNLSRPHHPLSIRSDSNFLDAFISQIPSAISRLVRGQRHQRRLPGLDLGEVGIKTALLEMSVVMGAIVGGGGDEEVEMGGGVVVVVTQGGRRAGEVVEVVKIELFCWF